MLTVRGGIRTARSWHRSSRFLLYHQGNGLKNWQCTLLNPSAPIQDRIAALEQLGPQSTWRKSLLRDNPSLKLHCTSPPTPIGDSHVDIESLQELKNDVVSAVGAFVPLAKAAVGAEPDVEKAVAMLEAAKHLEQACRGLADAALQQRAAARAVLHAAKERSRGVSQLRRAVEASIASVGAAVTALRAAVCSGHDKDVNRAIQRRGTALNAAQTSLRDTMDKFKNTGAGQHSLSVTDSEAWHHAEAQLLKFEQVLQAQRTLSMLLKV